LVTIKNIFVIISSKTINMNFTDKIVVITGAAGGIGTVLATRFLSEGAKICAVDTTDQALGGIKIKFRK